MPLQKASARMAESVDALVSNTSRFTPVPVRPRLRVLKTLVEHFYEGFFFSTPQIWSLLVTTLKIVIQKTPQKRG